MPQGVSYEGVFGSEPGLETTDANGNWGWFKQDSYSLTEVDLLGVAPGGVVTWNVRIDAAQPATVLATPVTTPNATENKAQTESQWRMLPERQAFGEAATLAPAVAKFFDDVLVMAEDARLREARLRLMKRLETLILQLADVSEIVPEESK